MPPGTGSNDIPANVLILLDKSGSMSTSISTGGIYRLSNNLDNTFKGESMAFVLQFEYNNVFFRYSHDFNTVNFKNLYGEVHGNELSIIINFSNY